MVNISPSTIIMVISINLSIVPITNRKAGDEMGINVVQARHQAQVLASQAKNLHEISNQIVSYESMLNSYWQAEEMKFVNQAINKIQIELRITAATLTQLESTIIHTAQMIRQEEEEEERKAAEQLRLR